MSKQHPSVKAYQKICKVLGVEPAPITSLPEPVEGATLVIVPDAVQTKDDLFRLAEEFGEAQPYPTYIDKDFLNEYSDEELSGLNDAQGEEYRWLYIPEEFNLRAGTVEEQAKAAQKATDRVPSLYEGIAYWYCLREAGKSLGWDSTYIRYIDLPGRPGAVGRVCVPHSDVDGDGGPGLDGAWAGGGSYGRGGRLAVGSSRNLAPLPSPQPSNLTIDSITVNGVEYVRKHE